MPEGGPFRPWGDHDLVPGDDHVIRIGPLHLGIRFTGDELWLAHAEDEGTEDGAPTGEMPVDASDLDWNRWAVPDGTSTLRLSPAFPDRPIVARPEHAFHLVRGAKVRIYVRVPLWVRVELAEPEAVTLAEVPARTLSDTWFGDPMAGELMYYLPTTARREVRREHFQPHLVVCPLQMSNTSTGDLDVEKISLRVAHLSVFGREGELWADETRVRYRSAEEGSDIEISGSPPAEARDARLVTGPREPTVRGFRARTFARIRGLSGLGGGL